VSDLTKTDSIRATLRARRNALGWSQQFLADQIGLSQPHICGLENGKETPAALLPSTLARWADALGFDVEVRLVERGDQR
jgi:transcriptional regulator with XRE-family HTH domain